MHSCVISTTQRYHTCKVDRCTSSDSIFASRRGPMVQKCESAVSVAPEGSKGQGSPTHLIPLIHLTVTLQKHF